MIKLNTLKLAVISFSLLPLSLISIKVFEIHLHFSSEASVSNKTQAGPATIASPTVSETKTHVHIETQPQNANFNIEVINGPRESWLITIPKDSKWHDLDLNIPNNASSLAVKAEKFETDWEVGLMWAVGYSVFPPMWHTEPQCSSFGIPLSEREKDDKIKFRNERKDGRVVRLVVTFVSEGETLSQIPF